MIGHRLSPHIPRPRGRGPVEAEASWAQCVRCSSTFRARAGAAPLKQLIAHQRSCERRPAKFRPRGGAAPLKPGEFGPCWCPLPRKSPAHPRGRGPVEASYFSSEFWCGDTGLIPRPRGRGPVEAIPVNDATRPPKSIREFRAPRGRGPVEALDALARYCFYWDNSASARAGAAPLKQR